MSDRQRANTIEFVGTALPAGLENKLFAYADHSTKRMLGKGGENAENLAVRSNMYREVILRELLPLLRTSASGEAISVRTRMRMAWEKAVDSESAQIQGDQSANFELMYARLWEQASCAAAFGIEHAAAEQRDIPPYTPFLQEIDEPATALLCDERLRGSPRMKDRLVDTMVDVVVSPRRVGLPDDPGFVAGCLLHLRNMWVAAARAHDAPERQRLLQEYSEICASIAAKLAQEPVTTVQRDTRATVEHTLP